MIFCNHFNIFYHFVIFAGFNIPYLPVWPIFSPFATLFRPFSTDLDPLLIFISFYSICKKFSSTFWHFLINFSTCSHAKSYFKPICQFSKFGQIFLALAKHFLFLATIFNIFWSPLTFFNLFYPLLILFNHFSTHLRYFLKFFNPHFQLIIFLVLLAHFDQRLDHFKPLFTLFNSF